MRVIITNEKGRDEFLKRVSEVKIDGNKRFIAEFKLYRIQRTPNQNRLYWMWLRCISQETGNEEVYLHDYFKDRHFSSKQIKVFGEEVEVRPSSRSLDTKEFTEYLEKIKVQMADNGIFLPEPGDAAWEAFYVQYGRI